MHEVTLGETVRIAIFIGFWIGVLGLYVYVLSIITEGL
jgi:hypothetical protein